MSKATLTLIGLYNYDSSLFDNLTFPDGIDKDTVVNNILLSGGEFEVLYSNPDFLKNMFTVFSRKYERTFTRWIKALSIDYEPLENYDRREEWTDSSNSSGTTSNNSSITGHTETSNGGSDTEENKTSAFDSSTYSPATQRVTTLGNTSTNTDSSTGIDSGSTENKEDSTHSGRTHGNIGVTTSQQMLESELDIASWNMYQHITDIFLNEFCIMVY